MLYPLIILGAQTLIFWLLVVIFYRLKDKFTLIPLYSYIAVMTVLTHNLSDLGFAVILNQWFFLIGSFSFFTTLMLGILYLYLFEGPRAGRLALWVVLFFSLLYIAVVYLLGLQVDTSGWVQLNAVTARMYFWSIFAISIDILFLAIIWELLSRVKYLFLLPRVFLVIFFVYLIDTLIFVTGSYFDSKHYFSILFSNIVIRLVLSLFAAPIITYFLKKEGYLEEKREKPKYFWEILNFQSDLEKKISSLEEMIKKQKILESQFREAQETYQLAINGVGAGVWDWDLKTDKIVWSPKVYALLGYNKSELKGTLYAFKNILHPQHLKKTFEIVGNCLKTGKPYETEYQLKTKSGKYHWFLANGVTQYDQEKKPIRMVGSIININEKKQAELELDEKVQQLTKMNDYMVARELRIKQLKEEVAMLKKQK